MKIVISAISADYGRFIEEENCQRLTWAGEPQSNLCVLWIKAKTTLSKPFLDADSNLFVPGEETVANVLRKRVTSTEFILRIFDPDFIVLTNSSSYIDLNRLERDLLDIHDPLYFGGYMNLQIDSRTPIFMEPFINGGFMVLSRAVAKKMLGLDPDNFLAFADDLAISRFLREAGITLTPMSISNIAEAKPYQAENSYFRIRHIAKPNITQKRMKEVHQLKNGKGSLEFFMLKETIRMNREIAEYRRSKIRAWSMFRYLLSTLVKKTRS